jgi:hypothetical protein
VLSLRVRAPAAVPACRAYVAINRSLANVRECRLISFRTLIATRDQFTEAPMIEQFDIDDADGSGAGEPSSADQTDARSQHHY